MTLPVELLRHIFSYIGDVECFDTIRYDPSGIQRYQYELATGRKATKTKWALLLVSRSFYAIAIELAWSWVSIFSPERLFLLDSLLREGETSLANDILNLSINQQARPRKRSTIQRSQIAYCIRRIEVRLSFTSQEYAESSPIIQALARLLARCTNLNVFISDITVATVDCQRISPVIRRILKTLPNLRRLDFAGHEGPSLVDYVEMIPCMQKLDQLITGRIPEPGLSSENIIQAIEAKHPDPPPVEQSAGTTIEGPALVLLPSLRAIQFSRRPLHSFLRLINHFLLPALTHLSIRQMDFESSRIRTLLQNIGPQLTHLYTHDIRTPDAPFGYARVFLLCPNLEHLTFAPRLRDDRHMEPLKHPKLKTFGLRDALPSTLPAEDQLRKNIDRSITQFIERIVQSRLHGDLPSLEGIRIEDDWPVALEMERTYGIRWDRICQQGGIVLEGYAGYRIPDKVPTPPHLQVVEPHSERKTKMKEIVKWVVDGLKVERVKPTDQ